MTDHSRRYALLMLSTIVSLAAIAGGMAASRTEIMIGSATVQYIPVVEVRPTAAPTVLVDRTGAEYVAITAGAGLAAFRMMRTEVTNAHYAQCVAAGACSAPGEPALHRDPARADHPVVYVRQAQARAYANWVGGALPTEAQWSRACQGDANRTYPWGEEPPDATLANFGGVVGDTAPVGSYLRGTGPFGTLDMAGNAWEWVEPDDGNPDVWIVRGGDYRSGAGFMACSARYDVGIDDGNHGFRVVAPAP
ncbi:MAG: formylglycine-generating enzyme family protein [Chloroflexi bacterium]|nr:formylglycine-generating enzyme family protein [Chloroflexota bacterium]